MNDEQLETFAAHCIAARDIAARANDAFLCYLLDMVLLEAGRQLALGDEPDDTAGTGKGSDPSTGFRGRDPDARFL
jgi:hypothetical protein